MPEIPQIEETKENSCKNSVKEAVDSQSDQKNSHESQDSQILNDISIEKVENLDIGELLGSQEDLSETNSFSKMENQFSGMVTHEFLRDLNQEISQEDELLGKNSHQSLETTEKEESKETIDFYKDFEGSSTEKEINEIETSENQSMDEPPPPQQVSQSIGTDPIENTSSKDSNEMSKEDRPIENINPEI